MGGAPAPDELLRMENALVVAAEVCERVIGTNSEPPRVRVRILEVIKGALVPGEHVAIFSPPSDAGFYAIRGGPEVHQRWKAQGYASPETGARVIFAANVHEGMLVVWARTLRPDSDTERARLRALLAEAP